MNDYVRSEFKMADAFQLPAERNPLKAVLKESISPIPPLKIWIKLMETGISIKVNERSRNVTVLIQANRNDITRTSLRDEYIDIFSW